MSEIVDVTCLRDPARPPQARLLALVFSDQLPESVIHSAILSLMAWSCDDFARDNHEALDPNEARIVEACRDAIDDSLRCLHQRPTRSEGQIVATLEQVLEDCRGRLEVVQQFRSLFSADAPLDLRWEVLYRLVLLTCEVCRIPLRRDAPISPARNGLFALNVHLSDDERARLCGLICDAWERYLSARVELLGALERRRERHQGWLWQERERLEEGLF